MTGRKASWIVVAVLVSLTLLQVHRALRKWRAGVLTTAVERVSIQAAQQGRMTPQLLDYNLDRLATAARLDPGNVLIPMLRGSQYLLMGRTGPALDAYDEALALEPRAEIYMNRGRALRLANDDDAAEVSFRTAIRLNRRLHREILPFLQARDRLRRNLERRAGARPKRRIDLDFDEDFERGHLRRWSKKKPKRGTP